MAGSDLEETDTGLKSDDVASRGRGKVRDRGRKSGTKQEEKPTKRGRKERGIKETVKVVGEVLVEKDNRKEDDNREEEKEVNISGNNKQKAEKKGRGMKKTNMVVGKELVKHVNREVDKHGGNEREEITTSVPRGRKGRAMRKTDEMAVTEDKDNKTEDDEEMRRTSGNSKRKDGKDLKSNLNDETEEMRKPGGKLTARKTKDNKKAIERGNEEINEKVDKEEGREEGMCPEHNVRSSVKDSRKRRTKFVVQRDKSSRKEILDESNSFEEEQSERTGNVSEKGKEGFEGTISDPKGLVSEEDVGQNKEETKVREFEGQEMVKETQRDNQGLSRTTDDDFEDFDAMAQKTKSVRGNRSRTGTRSLEKSKVEDNEDIEENVDKMEEAEGKRNRSTRGRKGKIQMTKDKNSDDGGKIEEAEKRIGKNLVKDNVEENNEEEKKGSRRQARNEVKETSKEEFVDEMFKVNNCFSLAQMKKVE